MTETNKKPATSDVIPPTKEQLVGAVQQGYSTIQHNLRVINDSMVTIGQTLEAMLPAINYALDQGETTPKQEKKPEH